MKIFLGADHRGVVLKNIVAQTLRQQGYDVEDLGTFVEDVACDYPVIAEKIAIAVAANPENRGVLICMSGIGHSIAANKVRGVYAALCYTKEAALLSRQHNNSNVLVLGSKFTPGKEMLELIGIWLKEPFEGGRHQRRCDQIKAMEQKYFK